jgi:hypothetical protein
VKKYWQHHNVSQWIETLALCRAIKEAVTDEWEKLSGHRKREEVLATS